ncbi:MAG: acyltransferase [Brevundimonas sp.]|nr:MAG: acyltransferase [Brevundimonas sp.]
MVLILYHVGMFYVPWDFHVKSPRPIEALEPIMMLTNPWRMTLLFIVSGCATRFMADGFEARGKGRWALAGSRTLRLLPPLLFGMFVIVPPQTYFQIVEDLRALGFADPAHSSVLANFWMRYATASGGWCDATGCIVTPTYNHLWFVAYLLIYSLILALLLAVPGVRGVLQAVADRAFKGWGLLVWPLAYLVLIRWVLAPIFEINHALVADWYNHALSFGGFLFGYFTARSETVRQGFMRLRWPALITAVVTYAAWASFAWIYRGDTPVPAEALRLAMRVVYATDQWVWIAAVLGFGARWLNRGGPVLKYLTVGVFPFYIAHQTVIVVVGHSLAQRNLPLAVEAPLLIGITALGCWITYEIARRLGWLGLLLGVRPERRPVAVAPQAANRPPLPA